MKKSYIKYFTALLLFGSNGIVASFISLSSYEIVLLRTLIGGLGSTLFIPTEKTPCFSFFEKQSVHF